MTWGLLHDGVRAQGHAEALADALLANRGRESQGQPGIGEDSSQTK